MQARDGRERACSERGAAAEPCAAAMAAELSARGGGNACAKRVWARSAYRCGGCSGLGAARVAAVPERSGPIGLARVRERAGADDVRSAAPAPRDEGREGRNPRLAGRRAGEHAGLRRSVGAPLGRSGFAVWGARIASTAAEHCAYRFTVGPGHPGVGDRQRRSRPKDAAAFFAAG